MESPPETFRLRGVRRALTRDEFNEHIIYRDAAIQAIMGSGIAAFLSVYVVRLGASDMLVGLLTSLPALTMTLMSLPAAALVQRKGNLVKSLNQSRILYRMGMSAFAILPFLSAAISPYLLVLGRSALSFASATGNVSLTTILGAATSEKRRARMLSMRMAVNGMAAALIGFVAGQWLDRMPFPINYSVLFGFAIVPAVLGVLNFRRLRMPSNALPRATQRQRLGARGMIQLLATTPSFRTYAILVLAFRLSLQIPAALYSIYRVREIGASDAWIGIILTIQRLFSMFGYLVLTRILRKRGVRRWLWLACVGTALYPILTTLAATPQQLIASAVAGGLFNSGFNIFITETLYRVSPRDQRPTFAAANAIISNISAFVGPIIGTTLSGIVGIGMALWIAGGLRVVTGFMMGIMSRKGKARVS